MTAIVRWALRFRGVVIALSCLLVGYGLYSLSRAKYDVFPEFAAPQVDIQTESPGLAPEQVEALVTRPIENVLNGVPGVAAIRSSSIQGLSVITVILEAGGDIYRGRQALAERLATLTGQLPQDVSSPVMSPLTSSTGDLMVIGLTSPKRSLMELRTVADWTVKQYLLSIPGVAQGISKIGVFGGEVRQIQIQVHPDRLVFFNLSIEDVLSSARRATGVRGAGTIDTDKQRFVLQTEGQSLTAAELAKTALVHSLDGNVTASVTLGDVADVVDGPELPISAASIMGEPGVVMNIWAQNGANTLETTAAIEQAFATLRPVLEAQDVVLHPDLFRAANFIESAVQNVKSSLALGAVLVVLILFLFLFNLRTAAISCAAIPLSLLGAVVVLEHLGLTLNTMTLGGLAIAIGEVVDDAVIGVENILRRLRENRNLGNPKPAFQVILGATIEVRSAVVYATFAVTLVFVPILTLSGLAGRLFGPLGIAYILAVFASLVVALTITPVLCLALLVPRDLAAHEAAIARWLKEHYRSLLLYVEKYPRWVIGGVAAFTVCGLLLLFFFDSGEFLPEFREGHFIIHMTAAPGTSLQESLKLGGRVTRELLKLPFMRSVAQRAGRAAVDDVFGTNSSELEVDLKPLKGKKFENAVSDIHGVLDDRNRFPGVAFAINSFLTERIEETLSGFTAPVVIHLFGNDLDVLDKKAQEIAALLAQVPGASDIQMTSPPGTPQIGIQLRKADLASWGFEPVDVLDALRTAYQGSTVGQIYEGNRVSDVSVILDSKERHSTASLKSLRLRSPTGTYVKLRDLADVRETSGRYLVAHEGVRRAQTVTCNVSGRGVGVFVREAKKQILSQISLPPGTYAEFSGTDEAQARSQRDLIVHSLLAGVGILLLLSVVMGNIRNLLLVLINLPFALVGGILAVLITGGDVTTGSLVGFVTLFGITLRNSIMMISHYEQLISEEGQAWNLETAIRGAMERLVPILMTALVTAFGLLPLALGSGDPGREIEGPMALVILGGLATSTLLNLLVLPTLALRYGRFERKDA